MGADDLPAESRSLFAEHVARMFHTYVLIPTQLVDMGHGGPLNAARALQRAAGSTQPASRPLATCVTWISLLPA
ncbi:hypothetical protein [Nocardia sp. NPDC050717]|uniref:hypothetical protein n=1 Tax=Nocardia sp. NPDC050717 TaxID=3157221 RepID=UPI0033C6C053